MDDQDWAEEARAPEEELTEEDFRQLADFLFARTDPLLLARPLGHGADPALQALNDVIRILLGQARAFRQWGNREALLSTWDALAAIAQQWPDAPGYQPDWTTAD